MARLGALAANASLVASSWFCLLGQSGVVGPAFEVASVKRHDPAVELSGGTQFTLAGRFIAPRITLRSLIQLAYGVDDFHLSGGPDWLKTELFNVQAKAASPASEAEMKPMIRTLVADRFQLKLHWETREIGMYALTVDKMPSKLEALKSTGDQASKSGFRVGSGSLAANRVTLASLAQVLSRLLGRPVLDRTGLDGTYDFKLEYDQGSVREAMVGLGSSASDGLSIFSAVRETLGLRLSPGKSPAEVLVIDSAERPSSN